MRNTFAGDIFSRPCKKPIKRCMLNQRKNEKRFRASDEDTLRHTSSRQTAADAIVVGRERAWCVHTSNQEEKSHRHRVRESATGGHHDNKHGRACKASPCVPTYRRARQFAERGRLKRLPRQSGHRDRPALITYLGACIRNPECVCESCCGEPRKRKTQKKDTRN